MKNIAVLTIITVLLACNFVLADEDGTIFDVESSGFTRNGEWGVSNLDGFDRTTVLTADASTGASYTYSITIARGLYDFYIWNCLKDDGSPDAQVAFSCTTATEKKALNMRRGITGFKYMGTYNLSPRNT